jgi:hypothetical protein
MSNLNKGLPCITPDPEKTSGHLPAAAPSYSTVPPQSSAAGRPLMPPTLIRTGAIRIRPCHHLKIFDKNPFFSFSGSGKFNCLQMAASTSYCATSEPSTTISSPTMTAGAAGRSKSKYSSVMYSALVLDRVSISTSYFSSSTGMICLKCFHGLPLGSLKKNLMVSMFPSDLYLGSLLCLYGYCRTCLISLVAG